MIANERRIAAPDLTAFAQGLVRSTGAKETDAARVAEHLVEANLSGHDSHGVGLLPAYIRHAQSGLVKLDGEPEAITDTTVLTQMHAHSSWGAPSADALFARAAPKARAHGLSCATLADAHHLGRVGAYAERLSVQGLVSMHFVNVTDHTPLVAPFRGSDARFGTNPVCIGFPASNERGAFLLDMATSRIALGKVRVAANKGLTVPKGALINEHGMETTDPSGMTGFEVKGALTPMARHKGYGLAFACELLAGVLSRSGTIQPAKDRRGGILNSLFSILIDPAAFGDPAWMAEEVDAMSDYATQSPPMDWDSPVLVPGDAERAWRGKREREGVPLDEITVDQLNEAAQAAGIDERL